LAHNVMGHIDKQMGNRMAGLVIGAIISGLTRVDVTRQGAELGGLAFSQEFEAEADYVGLYYTARAGYGITAAPNFWRRMAVNHPRAIAHGTTHPNTADRFVALEAAAREIDAKRVVGLDLKPEMKMPDFPTAAGPDPGATGSALGVTDPSKR
jgi:predicted Zn-dependent protease